MSGLSKEKIKEEVSICFVHALAAQSGMNYETPRTDNDSVDALISYVGGCDDWKNLSPTIGIQLKSTSVAKFDKSDNLIFQLPIKNYKDLIKTTQIPRILVVLVLNNKNNFVKLISDGLSIDGLGYWVYLKNYKTNSKAKEKITIKIPKKNKLTLESLSRMIHNVATDNDLTSGL